MAFNDLIPVINKLQDIFAVTGGSISGSSSSSSLVLELPQIVVVGSQSSGKSSVLESIVGRDFLPRGSGIVTRRPLVLQLFHTTSGDEYGEFLHSAGQRFSDFDEIRAEIERETDRTTGSNKGISDAPISLKIYSPHVVNLTLVDLPGITRVPVGDQPADIELQIRSMVMRYIEPANAIILAVTAANSDLANSDALRLARDVDPRGERTLGVLTKLDIMDQGTDALDVLNGRVIPLKLGYVAVVNRSQKDIKERKDVRKALADERAFFQGHNAYRAIAARCGVPFLTRTLQTLLLQHITAFVPVLRARLTEMRADAVRELAACGPETAGDTAAARQMRLLDILSKVADAFQHGLDVSDDADVSELASGARIHFIFQDVFGAHLASMDAMQGVGDNDIKTCLHNSAGTRPALFIAEAAFELLARRQLALLRDPALQCVDLVHQELLTIVGNLKVDELAHYTVLREAVQACVKKRLSACSARAKQLLNDVVDVELAFINIAHPDFVGADEVTSRMLKKSLRAKQQQQQQQQQAGAEPPKKPAAKKEPTFSKKKKGSLDPTLRRVPVQIRAGSYQTDKEKFEIDVIKTLMASYFDIARKRMRDLVPKTIMLFLVQKAQKDLQNALVSELYGDEAAVARLLQVSLELETKRTDMKSLLKLLDEALAVLSTIGSGAHTLATFQ